MRRRRQFSVFTLSFLDAMACGFGAAVLLFFMIIKNQAPVQAEVTQAERKAEITRIELELREGREMLARLQAQVETTARQIVDTQELTVGGWNGTVRTRAVGRTTVVEIECRSGSGATLGLDFDPQALAFLGFERASGGSGDVALTPGRVQLAPQGQNHYRIWFEAAGSGSTDLALEVEAGGATVQKVVRTANP